MVDSVDGHCQIERMPPAIIRDAAAAQLLPLSQRACAAKTEARYATWLGIMSDRGARRRASADMLCCNANRPTLALWTLYDFTSIAYEATTAAMRQCRPRLDVHPQQKPTKLCMRRNE